MVDKFLRIAITLPYAIENEGSRIARLLDTGFNYVHLRKPGWTLDQMATLIDEVPPCYRNRLRIHDHHSLAREYGLAGVHVNSRNRAVPVDYPYTVSCHSIAKLGEYSRADYVFLSPVFDSISKKGYKAAFNLHELQPLIEGHRVVALGGVTPDKIFLLQEIGFYGAAMLGAAW